MDAINVAVEGFKKASVQVHIRQGNYAVDLQDRKVETPRVVAERITLTGPVSSTAAWAGARWERWATSGRLINMSKRRSKFMR